MDTISGSGISNPAEVTKWVTNNAKGASDKSLTPEFFGAGNGIRTRDLQLGKLTLYH